MPQRAKRFRVLSPGPASHRVLWEEAEPWFKVEPLALMNLKAACYFLTLVLASARVNLRVVIFATVRERKAGAREAH